MCERFSKQNTLIIMRNGRDIIIKSDILLRYEIFETVLQTDIGTRFHFGSIGVFKNLFSVSFLLSFV